MLEGSMGIGKNATTTQTTSANPIAAQAYQGLINQAQNVAATPYQAYTGQLVAPVNAQQNLGISNINQNAGFATPAVNQALGLASGAANPLTQSQIANYQNPYTQNVVNATQAQFANQNQQQQAQLTGNQISQGALGGNRTGVAAANLANQQQLAQAPVIAGLYNQGYNQALQTAAQQYQQNPMAAAQNIANFGISGQNAALAGAGAQIGAGTLQQQTQQAQDTAAYNQFLQQQAYPFQTTQWLAGLEGSIGPQLGGTSQTVGPQPNPFSQILGLGLAGAGAAGGLGWKPFGSWTGGAIKRDTGGGVSGFPYSMSSMPYAGASGYVPTSGTRGGGHLSIHGPSAPQDTSIQGLTNQISGLSKYFKNDGTTMGSPGVSSPLPVVGGAGDYAVPTFMATGGKVAGFAKGYADGGMPTDFPSLSMGDPAWANPDVGSGYAVPVPETQFAQRWAALPASKVNPEFLSAYEKATGEADPRIEKAIMDAQPPVPLPVSRPADAPPVVAQDDQEDDVPVQVPTAGLGTPAQPFARDDAQAGFAAPGDEGSYGSPKLSKFLPQSLLAAGLGMLASRSPYFGVGIGEGGLTGLNAFNQAQAADQKAVQDAIKQRMEQARVDREAAALQETIRHNQAVEKQAADKVPEGYRSTKTGLEPIPGGPQDPETLARITAAKASNSALSDDDARAVASRYVTSGNRMELAGLGFGNVGSANRAKVNHFVSEILKEKGISNEEFSQRQAEWEGRKAAQRVLGTQEARMGTAAQEAKGAIQLARGIIEKVPRTSFLPFNQLIQGYQRQTLNPDQAELFARTQGIVNTYAAVMARGANVTTDSSRHRAEELLNTAADPAAYNRVLDTLVSEINMAIDAPQKMRDFYRNQYGAGTLLNVSEMGSPTAGKPAGFQPQSGDVKQNGYWYRKNASGGYDAVAPAQ